MISDLLRHGRLERFLNRGGPVCSITSFSRICSRPVGSFRKYDLPPASVGHLFEIAAVHVLAKSDRRNRDVLRATASFESSRLSPSSEIPSVSSTMCLKVAFTGSILR